MSSRKLVEGWIKYLKEEVNEEMHEAVHETDVGTVANTPPVKEADQSWASIRPQDMTATLNTISQFLAAKNAPDEVWDALAKVSEQLRAGGMKK